MMTRGSLSLLTKPKFWLAVSLLFLVGFVVVGFIYPDATYFVLESFVFAVPAAIAAVSVVLLFFGPFFWYDYRRDSWKARVRTPQNFRASVSSWEGVNARAQELAPTLLKWLTDEPERFEHDLLGLLVGNDVVRFGSLIKHGLLTVNPEQGFHFSEKAWKPVDKAHPMPWQWLVPWLWRRHVPVQAVP